MADDPTLERNSDGRSGARALRRRNLLRCVAVLLIAVIAAWGPAGRLGSQDQGLSEYQVKARYLYNFPLFVEWPGRAFRTPDSPFVLGIVGQDPFGGILDELASNRTLHGRKIVIHRLKRDQDLRQCQLLFISRSEKDHVGSILAKVSGGTVLTVSEIEGFSTTGGVIGLVFDDDRVRFEINLDNAASAGLTISAKLSSLARAVRRSVSSESVRRHGVTLAMNHPAKPPAIL
jgi:hypothetical protein